MGSYQGSTNSGCEVTIYRQQGDLGGITLLSGKTASDSAPSLISCHVDSSLGGVSSFGIVCKPEAGDTFFSTLLDDDWVDIVFTQNGKRWHKLRGLISGIRKARVAAGSGATTVTYTLSGRSFQRVLTDTKVYLNIAQSKDVFGDLALNVANGIYGRLEAIQPRILINVLQFLAESGRGSWNLPVGMPNSSGQFYTTFKVDTSGVPNTLPRLMEIMPFTIDNGDVWSLAQHYSDPNYTEIFCEQADFSRPAAQRYDLDGSTGLGVNETAMTVVVRDRPFILVDPRIGAPTGKNSAWFNLPLQTITRQQIQSEDLGTSGEERRNSFNAFTSFEQATLNLPGVASFSPFWSPTDMATHGIRRCDATSTYQLDISSGLSEDAFNLRRKLILKDWYCFNARYLNGSIQLGTGAPHLSIGNRLFVPGRIPNENLTFYIEGVTHSWQMPQGTRTSVSVTRGYEGTDDAHLAQLTQLASASNFYQGSSAAHYASLIPSSNGVNP